MKQHGWFTSSPLALPALINGGLGMVLGALVGGLHGSQIGLAVGISLVFVPVAIRWVGSWLARADSLPRFVGRQVGSVAIQIAASIAPAVGRVLSPIIALLQGPVLLARLATSVFAETAQAALAIFGRAFATPLGIANLAALIVIMLALARFESASIAVFAGFIIMIIVLLASTSEAELPDAGEPAH